MNKIPTVFERDWDGDRSRVLDAPSPGCEWVFAGEGVATRKYDGTCCLILDGLLFRRHEVKLKRVRADRAKRAGQHRDMRLGDVPEGFVKVAENAVPGYEETPELVGWVPVGAGPEDEWHRQAMESLVAYQEFSGAPVLDGTYELVGPKIQGNPESYENHTLVKHSDAEAMEGIVLTFDGIREVLAIHDVEGMVWHHPDGRMAKIKARDFGITRCQR